MVRTLNIPALSVYGMRTGDIPSAVEKAMKASSTKGNPIVLNEDELTSVLEEAL
jgi:alcohol dehydrogenase class IV